MESSFLMPKISAKFDRVHPLRVRGRQMQVEWVKLGDFRQIAGYISKTVRYSQLVRSRFVYDTYRTMEATRSRFSRHVCVHMFITHCPTATLQLHYFDLFRTCRTSSFCTVAWQLARFQLTRRIARSLGDS